MTTEIASTTTAGLPAARASAGRLRPLARRLRRHPSALIGLGILSVLVLIAIFPDLVARYDPMELTPLRRLRPPSLDHPLGTDEAGRDILSRLAYGARISLGMGAVVVAAALVIGVTLGAIAGYVGGWVDDAIMRVSELFLAFPVLVLAMAIIAALGPGITNAILAVALLWWAQYARLTRALVVSFRGREFVQAARTIGASDPRVLGRHILPQCTSPILVKATLDVGRAILITSGLSFIGLGVQPPTPEWGAMITTGRRYLLGYWWYPTFPGLAIFAAVMSVNLLGDGLRDALDPKLRY